MSTAPASSHASTTSAGHAAGARAAHAATRKPGAHGTGADHFSMLLSLLSASDPTGLPAIMGSADGSTALSATDALATDPNAATAADGSHLAAVMQWMGLPQGQAAKRTAVTDADTATGLATTGGRNSPGQDPAGILSGQTGANGIRATGQGDALPAGMQLLDRAESPDGATLAALAAGPTEGVAAETATPDQLVNASLANATSAATAPAHPGAGRISAHAPAGAHAQASPALSTQALQQAPVSVQIERLPSRGDNTATAIASSRSTVTLDERFSATSATGDALGTGAASSAVATAPASTGAGSPGGDLSGQTGHGGQDTSAAASSSGNDSSQSDSKPDDSALWAAEERAQNEERLDAFTTPNLHEAKLRVGDEGSDAIDIRLSLSGQELDLGFRTDSAEARAALADQAEGSLGEWLQRSGIQLGDVSVGAQNGQGAGGEARHSAGRSTPTARVERTGTAPANTPPTPLRPRTDGNRPLDTFA